MKTFHTPEAPCKSRPTLCKGWASHLVRIARNATAYSVLVAVGACTGATTVSRDSVVRDITPEMRPLEKDMPEHLWSETDYELEVLEAVVRYQLEFYRRHRVVGRDTTLYVSLGEQVAPLDPPKRVLSRFSDAVMDVLPHSMAPEGRPGRGLRVVRIIPLTWELCDVHTSHREGGRTSSVKTFRVRKDAGEVRVVREQTWIIY